MKALRINRRRFLWSAFFGVPMGALADAIWLEPDWLKVRRIRLAAQPTHRFIHLTDIHYKGDRKYLESVVTAINQLKPDFVCLTGDIIEDAEHLTEALSILKNIKCPIYGNPGNHDYWSHADFDEIADAFASTGGGWLEDSFTTTPDGKITISGAGTMAPPNIHSNGKTKNIMLLHYPE